MDTASSSTMNHELSLVGLRNPHGFKKCVWDCKRHGVNMAGSATPAIGGIPTMSREPAAGGSSDLAPLLTEIRDELRKQTELLAAKGAR